MSDLPVTAFVDQVARDKAQEALSNIGEHEAVCAERYQNIHEKLGTMMKVLGFGGATVATVVISIIGYLSVKLINVNDGQQAVLQAKVELLEAAQQHGSPPTGLTER